MNTYLGTPEDPADAPPRTFNKYPCLMRPELVAAVEAGRTVCEWRTRKGNRGWAQASLVEAGVRLDYRILPFYGEQMHYGRDILGFRGSATGQGRPRQLFVCPGCDHGVETLIFFRGWKCRVCQNLWYRSSSVSGLVRKTERLKVLGKMLSEGRPKGVHEATMQKYRDEYHKLVEFFKTHKPRSASNVVDEHICIGTWMRHSECNNIFMLDWANK
jgi:hypothetical protein